MAGRAGVGRQAVHARYGGKPGLLAALVVEFCGGFVRHVLRSGADTDSGSRLQGHPAGLAQLAAAMRDYAALRGPLARVALSARDLPWLARTTAPARRELEQLLAFQFGSARPSHEVLCLATELLACVARSADRRAPRVIGEPSAWRTAALLQELASALAPAAQQETG